MLVPAPPYSRFPTAVAVYVQTYLVGYLPAEVGEQVHRAVLSFAGAWGGRLPSCPAEIYDYEHGQQVVLLLDLQPLGLPHELLASVPEMARASRACSGSSTSLLRSRAVITKRREGILKPPRPSALPRPTSALRSGHLRFGLV